MALSTSLSSGIDPEGQVRVETASRQLHRHVPTAIASPKATSHVQPQLHSITTTGFLQANQALTAGLLLAGECVGIL